MSKNQDLECAGVILPDGRIDPDGTRFVDSDVALEPIIFPSVSSDPEVQFSYEREMLGGRTHDEAIAFAAFRCFCEHQKVPLPSFSEIRRTAKWFSGKPIWLYQRYWGQRASGCSQDVAFTYTAWFASSRDEDGNQAAFKDGDTICFLRVDVRAEHHRISDNFDQQVAYWKMVRQGESPKMAEILATRSFPGIKTDSIFNEGKFSGDDNRVGVEQKWLIAQAEAAGVSTTGKWYCRGLANFPGDPTAWVGDRSDVLRVAKEKNMTVHGYVEHKGYEVDPGGNIPIADDLVNAEVADILDSNPDAKPEDVREQVYALRSGAVDNNPLLVKDYESTDIP